jgi:hypothetical protein
LKLGEQRVRIFEIDRYGISPLNFDTVLVLEPKRREVEGAYRAQTELSIPGPFDVFGGKLVVAGRPRESSRP